MVHCGSSKHAYGSSFNRRNLLIRLTLQQGRQKCYKSGEKSHRSLAVLYPNRAIDVSYYPVTTGEGAASLKPEFRVPRLRGEYNSG